MIPPPIKGSLETKVRNYLIYSYYNDYDLGKYFTEKDQIIMFERLLSCDATFKEEWEKGAHSVPEDPTHTMYLSPYIKKYSSARSFSRKISKHTYNNMLKKGAKNLLKAYMRNHEIDYMRNKDMDTKIDEMFCGIFKSIDDRKRRILSTKVPEEVATEIFTFIPKGGTKRKRFINSKKRATLKK